MVEITFHTRSANGLLIWTSKDSQTLADYLVVALVDGYLEFSYNLEKQSQYLATLRSANRMDDGETHSIIVSRYNQWVELMKTVKTNEFF